MIKILDFVTAIWLISAVYLCGVKPKLGWLLYSLNSVFYVALMISKDLYFMAVVGIFLGLIGVKNYRKEKSWTK